MNRLLTNTIALHLLTIIKVVVATSFTREQMNLT